VLLHANCVTLLGETDMAGLTFNALAGNLTIGGIAMMCPSWEVQNLAELWLPANQRGIDVIRPGVSGVKARLRRDTVTVRTLRLLIIGSADRNGVAQTDLFEGLQANFDYLRANVVAPTNTTDGTRSVVLTMPDGTTRTEPAHVQQMEVGRIVENGAWALATIELSIPSGRIQ
jgi:hypothetical protein